MAKWYSSMEKMVKFQLLKNGEVVQDGNSNAMLWKVDELIAYVSQYFTLKKGLYAVFIHKGTSAEFPKTFLYILGQWLPQSEYELDDRPHFEILGEKYKNNDPSSEEEVWVPIRKKASL